MLDLLAFPEDSKVWIYTADRLIPDKNIAEIHHSIQFFTEKWQSHGSELVATGGILHNCFIVFVVDESKNSPGGCSIDKSIHFVQTLGTNYKIDFFNRQVFQYLSNEEIKMILMTDLPKAFNTGIINNETLFFDNLVSTKKDFQNYWLKPFGQSWHKRFA